MLPPEFSSSHPRNPQWMTLSAGQLTISALQFYQIECHPISQEIHKINTHLGFKAHRDQPRQWARKPLPSPHPTWHLQRPVPGAFDQSHSMFYQQFLKDRPYQNHLESGDSKKSKENNESVLSPKSQPLFLPLPFRKSKARHIAGPQWPAESARTNCWHHRPPRDRGDSRAGRTCTPDMPKTTEKLHGHPWGSKKQKANSRKVWVPALCSTYHLQTMSPTVLGKNTCWEYYCKWLGSWKDLVHNWMVACKVPAASCEGRYCAINWSWKDKASISRVATFRTISSKRRWVWWEHVNIPIDRTWILLDSVSMFRTIQVWWVRCGTFKL